jgi:LPXTG-motif cell wall-anchored protein
LIVFAVPLLAFVAFGIFATTAGATKPPDHKITICHATDSYTNPYVVITVDVASAQFAGHQGHDGPIFYPDIPKHEKWGDIIPPTSDDGTRAVTPKNWTPEGQSIWANGCQLPSEVTTTAPPLSTTSSIPGGTSVPTTIPGGTTIPPTSIPGGTTIPPTTIPGETTIPPTTIPGETTIPPTTIPGVTTAPPTTAPPSTTPPTTSGETSSSESSSTSSLPSTTPPTTGGGSTSSTAPPTTLGGQAKQKPTTSISVEAETAVNSSPATTSVTVEAASLPHTGTNSVLLTWIAFVIVIAGAALVGGSARRVRR